VDIAERIISGDIRSAARLIRDIDDEIPSAKKVLKKLYPYTGKAHLVGITGPPGSGKSTLTDRLVSQYREKDKSVGIVAVDPTSPFSGGAILGDRIRMQRHFTDSEVFIRSLATRGHLGGLSSSTMDIVHVMDAMGKDIVIIETVGVGQDEVEISRMAHTSLVISVPGLGDEIQSIKAGLMEIANIFVVNKADREGADRTALEIEVMLMDNNMPEECWMPRVIKTCALDDSGIDELMECIEEHRQFMSGEEKMAEYRRKRAELEVKETLHNELLKKVVARLQAENEYEAIIEKLIEKSTDPYTTTEEIMNKYMK
jgi:LAO/AO transport system kinase